MRRGRHVWLWSDTIKKIDSLNHTGEPRAKLVDDIVHFYDDNVLILESWDEKIKRTSSVR